MQKCNICGREYKQFIIPDLVWDIVKQHLTSNCICYNCFTDICGQLNLPENWALDLEWYLWENKQQMIKKSCIICEKSKGQPNLSINFNDGSGFIIHFFVCDDCKHIIKIKNFNSCLSNFKYYSIIDNNRKDYT